MTMMPEKPLPREFQRLMDEMDRSNARLARWSLWWPKAGK